MNTRGNLHGFSTKDTQHHCYGDYLTWPDDIRYELIDGIAYAMSPAPDLAHQDVVGEIYLQARLALQGKPCRAFIAPVDVRLPNQDEADERVDTVVQPDVMVVCDSSKLDRRGIREYWLIHPIDRVLTVYSLVGGEYGKPEIYELRGETRVNVLPDIVIQWDDLAARLPVDY
jgi:Uma2 family endonuclease